MIIILPFTFKKYTSMFVCTIWFKQSIFKLAFWLVVEPFSQNPGFRYPQCCGEKGGCTLHIEQGFYIHFLPNFCHIWWFFKLECTEGAVALWKGIKHGKKWIKALLTCLPPIFSADSGYVSVSPLFWIACMKICTKNTHMLQRAKIRKMVQILKCV